MATMMIRPKLGSWTLQLADNETVGLGARLRSKQLIFGRREAVRTLSAAR